MNDKIKQLLQDRAKLIEDARKLVDAADTEKRSLTSEEQERFDTMFADAEKLQGRADDEKKLVAAETALHLSDTPTRSIPGREDTPDTPAEKRQVHPTDTPEYRAAYENCLRATTPGEEHIAMQEFRALQADVDISGGFLVTPQEMIAQLIKAVDDRVYMRQWATNLPMTKAESIGIPTLDADPADADWTTELAIGSEDSTMAVGKRELFPHPLAKLLKVSKKLLRSSFLSVDGLVRDRLAYKFAVAFEKAGLTGTGSGQPLGVFIASANGITTGRDVATGNTTTAPTFDGLKEAKYFLKGQYWAAAKWLAHRDTYKLLAKIKDGEGRYIWEPSVRAAEPDRLLNIPSFMSEFAPNTFTAGLYVAILGDFSNYWIADALNMEIQVVTELYAATNQNGYIGRMESDGMPVLEEAFVRVTLAP